MAQLPDTLKPITDAALISELRVVAELPEDVEGGRNHGGTAGDHGLGMILAAVNGDVDLAATAIAMEPRPDWVAEMLGPNLGLIGN